jgi:hypothetical protein
LGLVKTGQKCYIVGDFEPVKNQLKKLNMPKEFETEEVRDRTGLNEEADPQRSQQSQQSGTGMEEFLQQTGPQTERETGGDGDGGNGGDSNSSADNTPPSDDGDDAPSDGDGAGADGGGLQEEEEGSGVEAGGLSFNYGPLSATVSEDYKTVKSATLNFLGNQDIQTSVKVEPSRKGYKFYIQSEKKLSAGLGPFSAQDVTLKKLVVWYNKKKNSIEINDMTIKATALAAGSYLSITDLTAVYKGKNPQDAFNISMGKASGAFMGHSYEAKEGDFQLTDRGQVVKAGWAKIKAGNNLKAAGLNFTADGISLQSADMLMPTFLGRTVRAQFSEVNVPKGQKATGKGQISVNEPFKFLNNQLQVDGLTGNVEIKDDSWFVDVLGKVNYTNGGTKISGGAKISYQSATNQANLSLENGQFETSLSGMKFVASGVAYDSAQDVLQILQGSVQIPQIGPNFTASVTNMTYKPDTGVDFEKLALTASEGIKILPGFNVKFQEAAIIKSNQDYAFELADAVADVAIASFKGHTKVSLRYDQATGLTGTVQQFEADSPFFSLSIANAPFENGAFSIEKANLSLKNLGPVSGTNVEAQGIKYDNTGLNIGAAHVDLPKIGDVSVYTDITNFKVGEGGISVGSAKIKANGNIVLAGGAVRVDNFDGDADFNGETWKVNAGGKLGVNINGVEAEGDVKVGYNNGQPLIDLAGGKLKGQFGQIKVDASELSLSYGSGNDRIAVGKADVQIPELAGLNVKTTVNNASFGSDGFNTDGIHVVADGTLEPFKGFKISKIEGNFVKKGAEYQVDAKANAKLSSKSINGTIENLKVVYGSETKSMSFTKMVFSTPVAQGVVNEAEVSNETIKMKKALMSIGGLGVRTNKGYNDKFKMTAEGLEYDKEGFRLASSTATLPPIGGRKISATISNLNIPAEGGITGSGEINLGGDISLAGGAITVANPTPYFGIENDAWKIGAKGTVKFNVANSTGSGNVDINYDNEKGVQVNVSKGQAQANLFNGKVLVNATGLGFTNADPETGDGKLTITEGTIKMPKLGSGFTASVSNMQISGKEFNFDEIAVVPTNPKIKLFDGLSISAKSIELSKPGEDLDAKLTGGITLARNKPKVFASVNGSINYNTEKGFSGTLNAFNLETSLFKAKATKIQVGTGPDGLGYLSIGEARMGLGTGVTAEALGQYFPSIAQKPWILDVVQGVEFVAEQITYNKAEGLKIGHIYPEIPPVEFEMMGMKGMIDLKNQKGSLSGSKKWDLNDFGINPELEATIPIIAGINGKLSLSAGGHIELGAGLDIRRQPDGAWRLAGGIDVGGEGSVTFGIGVSIGNKWLAEASAKLNGTLAVPFRGGAKIGTAIRYNPATKGVEVVDKLDFAANFLAELRTRLDLDLEAAVLGGLWSGKTTYNIGDWLLGSMSFIGTSSGSKIGEMFGNFKAKLGVYSNSASELWSAGSYDQAAASRLGVSQMPPKYQEYN